MGLVTCVECSREVSTLAKACPHCGRPTNEAWKPRKAAVWCARAVLLAIVGWMIVAATTNSDQDPFYGFAALAAAALVWSFFRVRVVLYVAAALAGLITLVFVPMLVFA